MDLVLAVALLGMAAIVSVFVLLAVRRPVTPVWAGEFLVANVWIVAITGLLAFAVCFTVRFAVTLKSPPVTLVEIALIAGTLATCYLILRLMAPKRRLAEYAAQIASSGDAGREQVAANVISLAAYADNIKPPTEPNLHKVA